MFLLAFPRVNLHNSIVGGVIVRAQYEAAIQRVKFSASVPLARARLEAGHERAMTASLDTIQHVRNRRISTICILAIGIVYRPTLNPRFLVFLVIIRASNKPF